MIGAEAPPGEREHSVTLDLDMAISDRIIIQKKSQHNPPNWHTLSKALSTQMHRRIRRGFAIKCTHTFTQPRLQCWPLAVGQTDVSGSGWPAFSADHTHQQRDMSASQAPATPLIYCTDLLSAEPLSQSTDNLRVDPSTVQCVACVVLQVATVSRHILQYNLKYVTTYKKGHKASHTEICTM